MGIDFSILKDEQNKKNFKRAESSNNFKGHKNV